MSAADFPTIRGRRVRVDENGLVCLNDIWEAAGFSRNQRPSDWTALPTTMKLIQAVIARNTGKSGNWAKNDFKSIYYTKRGAGGGTFMDVRLALAYAEYLNPKLGLEVREVFLRYKAGDPTLADEVLERASPEANEWAARRAIGRAERRRFTDTLRDHGVTGPGYGMATNAQYVALFGKTAKQIKAEREISASAALRDKLETSELVYIAAAEHLGGDRIRDEECHGNRECAKAAERSAGFIRDAIERDKADRKRRLSGL